MKPLIFSCLAFLILSCNNSAENATSSGDTNNSSVPDTNVYASMPVVSGCYLSVTGRDTLVARLQSNGSGVNGRLVFDNYQKDGSRGTVNGVMEGDVIKLSYVFTSEGMNSVMDVFFKLNGDSLIRGIGEMDVRGDTAYYVDTSNIRYEGSVLKRVNCSQVGNYTNF